MSLAEQIQETIAANAGHSLTGALADAERLADQYADIIPAPYIVPIERFVGMVAAFDVAPATSF